MFGDDVYKKINVSQQRNEIKLTGKLSRHLRLLESLNDMGAKELFYDFKHKEIVRVPSKYTKGNLKFHQATETIGATEDQVVQKWNEFLAAERGIALHMFEFLTRRHHLHPEQLLTYRQLTPTYKIFSLHIDDLCQVKDKNSAFLVFGKTSSDYFIEVLRKKFGWRPVRKLERQSIVFKLADMPDKFCHGSYHEVSPVLQDLLGALHTSASTP
jgi:hypothetical protein